MPQRPIVLTLLLFALPLPAAQRSAPAPTLAPRLPAHANSTQSDDPESENAEYSRQLVFLDSVTPYKNHGRHYIEVNGRAPDVPIGTIVDFVLTFRSISIDSYEFTVPESRRIRAEFEAKEFPRSRERFYFRTIIDSKKQTKAVLAKIEQADKVFRPALDPWTDHHYTIPFRLLNSTDAKASLEPMRAFFRERLARIAALRQAAAQEAELASLGEKYTKTNGGFDPVKWRRFLDAETIPPLLEIIEDVSDGLKRTRYIPFRRSLVVLESLAKIGILSCYETSLGLFRANGVPPPAEYVKAIKLDLTRKERLDLRSMDLAAAEELIMIELGLQKSDRVEDAFLLIGKPSYEGILFRHLTAEELRDGSFDPVRSRSTWTPTAEDLDQLEKGLIRHVQSELPDILPTLTDYRRQYVGLGETDALTIHVSLVQRNSVVASKTLRTVQPANSAFGVMTVQYDVASRSFGPFDLGE